MSRLVDRIRREEELKNPTPPSDIPPVDVQDLIAAEIDAWLISKTTQSLNAWARKT